MRSRILFVDDDQAIREFFELFSERFGRTREVITAGSGAEALEYLEENPVDVVISDLRMPEMAGEEFLARVERIQPDTIRVVISGDFDQLELARCLMYGHRYFKKPLNLAEFSNGLDRVCELKSLVQDPRAKRVLGSGRSLPSPSEVFLRLTEAMNDAASSAEEYSLIIASDPQLESRLLAEARSKVIGAGREFGEILEAVEYFGADVLRSIIFAAQAAQFAADKGVAAPFLEELWQRSMATGCSARKIAGAEGRLTRAADDAFAAGLLHDAGKLILAANAREEYEGILEKRRKEGGSLIEAEKEAFGATHAEVGAFLLGLWGFSETVISAVQLHHSLENAPSVKTLCLAALHGAQSLGGLCGDDASLDMKFLEKSGHAGRVESWREAVAQAGWPCGMTAARRIRAA